MEFKKDSSLDVICIGRAGVDFYATEREKDFNDVQTYERYVGGSPANIAAALAKRGAKVGFIGKVSDDILGRYVIHYFDKIGVDTSSIKIDQSGRTRSSLAVTETKARDCGVVIYRNDASDITVDIEDIDEEYIKKAKVLVVSGATLATLPSRDASLYAMDIAHKHGVKVVIDFDYRKYSWRCPEEVSLYYNIAGDKANIVIGNREEFDALEYLSNPGNTDDTVSAKRFFDKNADIVIVKHGKEGSKTYLKDGSVFEFGIYDTPPIMKPHGAGDSFAGNFIYEILQGSSVDRALKAGSAAAAIVVSEHISCSEACPTTEILDKFMAKYNDKGEYLDA